MAASRSLGAAIRERRIALDLTQEELAARIGGGVRQAEVSRLERDRIQLPRRERLERIAAALDWSVGDLLAQAAWDGAERAFSEPPAAPPSPTPEPMATALDDHPRRDDLLLLREALNSARETSARNERLRAEVRERWGR